MSRSRLLLLALAALAVGLGGCGGADRLSKRDYEQKLTGVGQELADASKPLAQAKTGPEFVSGVEQIQDGLRKAADDLGGLKPPKDVESANDRLVDALRGLADEFDKVKEAAKGGVKKAREAGGRLAASKPSEEARQAVLEIQRRGYDVGLLSST
jgi:hypothetical protein